MKKIGIVLLIVCMVFGSVGFAVEEDASDLPEISQKVLFSLPIEDLYLNDVYDFDYNPQDGLVYIITEYKEETDDGEFYEGYQFVFDLNGVLADSDYEEIEDMKRLSIAFDGNHVYSLEYDDGTSASYVYDADLKEEIGGYDEIGYDGFTVEGNRIAFHMDRGYATDDEDVNFNIGTLDPFVASDSATKVRSFYAGRVAAFDFTPSGNELIYGAFSCEDEWEGEDGAPEEEDWLGAGFRVKMVSTETGDLNDEFLLTFPSWIDIADVEDTDGMYNAIRGLYATDDYIVVMTKLNVFDTGFIQRYTYEGELIESIEIEDYYLRFLTEGPNDTALYLHPNDEDDDYLDVVQVQWNVEEQSEPTGRPKSVISERSFGGQTIAEFKDDGFGLLRVEDAEKGELNYRAPLKSDEMQVKLRIPFADLQGKLSAGAENLLIEYQGQQIQIPMSAFDCADLLAGMPCQDDATIEIQLTMDEAGNVKVTVQLFVVEQVNVMTKVVHRKTIQY